MKKVTGDNFTTLKGTISIPSDKSMSHRAVLFSSLAKGTSIIKNFSIGEDPHSSIKVCKNLGVNIEFKNETTVKVLSIGKLIQPDNELYCGNSGTTMRLMTGILAGQKFKSILTGDESLSKRPMKRVIDPLSLMGAKISSNEGKSPLLISGTDLHSINYTSKIASAQVKSCILLAGMQTNDNKKTIYTEPYLSRNHTEILLKHMGANISTDKNTTAIENSKLNPINIEIFGDISSAAYFIVAALIIPNSDIIIKNVGLNPTRTGIIEIAKKMGGDISIIDKREICGEIVGDIRVKYSELKACNIEGEIIPKLIDEIPVIAVMATQAKGQTIIKDASDLRNKESDRIKTVVAELQKLGANIQETSDGIIINGKTQLTGNCSVETYQDHRLAMSLYIAGLICQKEIVIDGFEWVNISFPNFESLFETIKH